MSKAIANTYKKVKKGIIINMFLWLQPLQVLKKMEGTFFYTNYASVSLDIPHPRKKRMIEIT